MDRRAPAMRPQEEAEDARHDLLPLPFEGLAGDSAKGVQVQIQGDSGVMSAMAR